ARDTEPGRVPGRGCSKAPRVSGPLESTPQSFSEETSSLPSREDGPGPPSVFWLGTISGGRIPSQIISLHQFLYSFSKNLLPLLQFRNELSLYVVRHAVEKCHVLGKIYVRQFL